MHKDAVKPDEKYDCRGNFCRGKLYLKEDVKDVDSLTPFLRRACGFSVCVVQRLNPACVACLLPGRSYVRNLSNDSLKAKA